MSNYDSQSKRHPVRLENDTILEAICEIRFDGSSTGVSTLLPGLLFGAMRESLRSSESLQPIELPSIFTESQPALRFQPTQRLVGEGFVMYTGEHVLGFACNPYLGWLEFKSRVQSMWGKVADFNLVKEVSRISLKYVNMIEFSGSDISEIANFDLLIGGVSHRNNNVMTRTERADDDVTTIIQIVNPANAKSGEKSFDGCLVDIDVVKVLAADKSLLTDGGDILEELHLYAKDAFFSILSDSALKERGAVYE